MRFLLMLVVLALSGSSVALASSEREYVTFDLYDCGIAATSLRNCQPANVVEWKQGEAFTLGLRLRDELGNKLGDTRVKLAVLDSDGEIISDALMLWGSESVVASTNADGEVLFKHIFLPQTLSLDTRLVVMANFVGLPSSHSFSLVNLAPPQLKLVGKPIVIFPQIFPPRVHWTLTYDKVLPVGTEVTWYAVASDGISATYQLELLKNKTNRIGITADSIDVNRDLYSHNGCYTLVVRVTPPGVSPETITASRIGC